VCVEKSPLGAACTWHGDCDDGGRCLDGTCTIVVLCAEGSEGEACGWRGDCSPGLACNGSTWRCESTQYAGDKAPGAACSLHAECASGACLQRLCVLRPEGGRCYRDEQCASDRCVAYLCAPKVACAE
jgi:hypothetical protein